MTNLSDPTVPFHQPLNDAVIRELAHVDPLPNISRRHGELVAQANRELDALVTTLGRIDGLTGQLKEHGVTVSVDLGPIGNAAAAARRDLEAQRDTPRFEMPRV